MFSYKVADISSVPLNFEEVIFSIKLKKSHDSRDELNFFNSLFFEKYKSFVCLNWNKSDSFSMKFSFFISVKSNFAFSLFRMFSITIWGKGFAFLNCVLNFSRLFDIPGFIHFVKTIKRIDFWLF